MDERSEQELIDSIVDRTMDLVLSYKGKYAQPNVLGTILGTLLDVAYFDLGDIDTVQKMFIHSTLTWKKKRKSEKEKDATNT